MLPIRIIFVEPHAVFRRLASRALERHFADDLALLAEGPGWPLASPPPEGVEAVLVGADGLVDRALLDAIAAALPGTPIVVLGHLHDEAYSAAALAAGAAAFVAKLAVDTELVPTLRLLTGREAASR